MRRTVPTEKMVVAKSNEGWGSSSGAIPFLVCSNAMESQSLEDRYLPHFLNDHVSVVG